MDAILPISTSLGLKSKAVEDLSFLDLGPKLKVGARVGFSLVRSMTVGGEASSDEDPEPEEEDEAESSSRKSSVWRSSNKWMDAMVR